MDDSTLDGATGDCDFDFRELLGSNRCVPQGLAAHTEMKNSDWPRFQLKNESCEILAARIHSQHKKNDSSKAARLSKIAHKAKSKLRFRDRINTGVSARIAKLDHRAGVQRSIESRAIESHGCVRVRQIEFPSTVEADLICAVFDCEHTAEVTVPAAKDELKNRRQSHKSCAR
ncbi:MAG: hypothetical protein WA604_21875 [Candidatus Sulfotelmatobacter sp.]